MSYRAPVDTSPVTEGVTLFKYQQDGVGAYTWASLY